MSTEERELRRRLRGGDQAAFDAVYAEHVDGVFTLAHRLTGNWATAEDVTSETFLTLWRNRTGLADDDRPLRAWLLAITTRQAMNATRSRRRLSAFLARAPGDHTVPDFADGTAQRLDDAHTLARTAQVLRLLTRTETEVLVLCVWSGLSYAEAAETLGVPVGTVRSRLSRARARLRALTDDPPSDAQEDIPARTTTVRGGRP